MAISYPYYPQQQPYLPQMPQRVQYVEQSQIGIKGRPVSSIEEVRATSIDFDGSVFFFPDLANRRIYTKQINLDGTSTLNVYELKTTPVEPNPSQYITREEFEQVIEQLKKEKTATLPQPQVQVPVKTTPPMEF